MYNKTFSFDFIIIFLPLATATAAAAVDTDLARSPPGSYEQTWPPANQKEFSQTDKPPFLPPHLLNIILNKDTAAHVSFFFLSLRNFIR